MNAIVYLRVSSRSQEDNESLEVQERDCRAYCTQQGYKVSDLFTEVFSAYETLRERPVLWEARDRIQKGTAQVLVVWKFDRMSREPTDSLLLLRELTGAGIRIESALEGPVDQSEMGKLMLYLRGFAAAQERDSIILRTSNGMRNLAKKGHILVSAIPKFGYEFTEGKENYVPNPDTAPVIQRAFHLILAGKSLNFVVNTFNTEGVLTPTAYLASKGQLPGRFREGKWWTRQSLYAMLTDPSYCGRHAAYRRKLVKTVVIDEKGRQVTHKRQVLRAEDDTTRIEQTIPALISPQDWQRVQEALHSRMAEPTRGNGKAVPGLLTRGFAYCGLCGNRCITSRQTVGYAIYQCANRSGVVDPLHPCPGGAYAVRAELADADVWGKVQEMAAGQ